MTQQTAEREAARSESSSAPLRNEGQRSLGIALLLESDGPGGAETMMLQLAEALRDRGHAVCPVGPGNGCGWLADEFRRRGFRPELFVMRRHRFDWRCLLGLVHTLRRRHVQLVHNHDFMMALYRAAAPALLLRPHVITMHGGGDFAGPSNPRVQPRRALARAASAVA